MNIIEKLAPFIGVILGFALGQFGEFFKDRKERKKTLKKLLFNLLELYNVLDQELNFESSINEFWDKFMSKIPEEGRKEAKAVLPQLIDVIRENFESTFIDNEKSSYLEDNIDSIISDLSEVYPLFAYELSGQYKIKDRLKRSEDYFNRFAQLSGDTVDIGEVKEWLTPKITEKLIERLRTNILEIAKSISRGTYEELLSSNLLNDGNVENPELDNFLDDYFNKFIPKS